MGGLAFASKRYTPRMPAAVYQAIRIQCRSILSGIFVCVASPIDGPGKKDFGDVDFLVLFPQRAIFPDSITDSLQDAGTRIRILERAASILKAVDSKRENSTCISIAIPWPTQLAHMAPPMPPAEAARWGEAAPFVAAEPCTQVDIRLCDSLQQFQWGLFKHGHGDIWSILGRLLPPLGFTVDDTGLHIRIPEMETVSPKLAKVLLTKDPVETLSFLGMRSDGEEWSRSFDSGDALFQYITTCRLFWLGDEVDDNNRNDKNRMEKLFKPSDRRRINTRPLIREWYEVFLPRLRALRSSDPPSSTMTTSSSSRAFPPTSPPYTREQLRHEALVQFFPHAKPEYDRKLAAFLRNQQDHYIASIIPHLVPLPLLSSEDKSETQAKMQYSIVNRALKKIVIKDQADSFGLVLPFPLRGEGEYGILIEENVTKFVKIWWPVVLDKALKLHEKKRREGEERKKVEKEERGGGRRNCLRE